MPYLGGYCWGMDRPSLEAKLDEAEAALAGGGPVDLAGLGFWKAVGFVKRHPELVDEYGPRIARIDREAFERWAVMRTSLAVGTTLMVVATIIGLVLIGLAYGFTGWGQAIALGVGVGILLVSTHSLAHQLVGSLQGMRFTHWFIGKWIQPYPGVKVDYDSYLRVPPEQRALMHASGAIVTKLVPVVGLGAAWAMGAEPWVLWVLVILTLVGVVTDVFWSTKVSDWKKYKRERALAGR